MTQAGRPGRGSRSPTDIDLVVGQNVRKLRIARNQTLSDLAGELGISHQQLQKYETGSNRLSAGMVARIADLLDVPLENLFRSGEPRARALSPAAEEMEALRKEAGFFLSKARSRETLRQMVDVLKVLAAGK